MKFAYDVLARSKDTVDALSADVVGALSKVWNHGPHLRCWCSLGRSFGIRYHPKRTSSGLGGYYWEVWV